MCDSARWNLVYNVLELSEAEDWENARREWKVTDCIEDVGCSGECVCGKENLRYLFTIVNIENGNTLFPIGSTCIEKFEIDEMAEEQKCWRQAMSLMNEAVRLGRDNYVPFTSKFFSRKLLWFIYEKNGFHDVRKDPDEDEDRMYSRYTFMLNMFNKRSRTEKQEQLITVYMKYAIYPWLRNLYRETRLNKE